MGLEISRSVMTGVLAQAAASPGVEVCGLLFGDGRVEAYQPCANVAERPADSFEIDPRALIAAYRTERAGGRRISGCYHSHPSGDAMPSARDAQAAEANGWVWLIVGGGEVKAFRAVEGGAIHHMFDPVDLRVE